MKEYSLSPLLRYSTRLLHFQSEQGIAEAKEGISIFNVSNFKNSTKTRPTLQKIYQSICMLHAHSHSLDFPYQKHLLNPCSNFTTPWKIYNFFLFPHYFPSFYEKEPQDLPSLKKLQIFFLSQYDMTDFILSSDFPACCYWNHLNFPPNGKTSFVLHFQTSQPKCDALSSTQLTSEPCQLNLTSSVPKPLPIPKPYLFYPLYYQN